jgi:predicted esterase
MVVALHGFGDTGKDFAQPLLPMAEANHWILVAPTFHYHDLRSEVDARQDNLAFAREVSDVLAELPRRVGRPLDQGAFMLGFSRGASLAENFALLYPGQVAAAAFLSAGAYTLPQGCVAAGGHVDGLPLPLGTADVAARLGRPFDRVAFHRLPLWVSVGSADDRPGTLLSHWDDVLGPTRLARGKAFAQALTAFGAHPDFTVFDNAGHEVTPAMLTGVERFFQGAGPPASEEGAA